jgi:hypothetical protein
MAVCESVCVKPAKLEGTIDLAAAFPLPLSTLLPKAEGGRDRDAGWPQDDVQHWAG